MLRVPMRCGRAEVDAAERYFERTNRCGVALGRAGRVRVIIGGVRVMVLEGCLRIRMSVGMRARVCVPMPVMAERAVRVLGIVLMGGRADLVVRVRAAALAIEVDVMIITAGVGVHHDAGAGQQGEREQREQQDTACAASPMHQSTSELPSHW